MKCQQLKIPRWNGIGQRQLRRMVIKYLDTYCFVKYLLVD